MSSFVLFIHGAQLWLLSCYPVVAQHRSGLRSTFAFDGSAHACGGTFAHAYRCTFMVFWMVFATLLPPHGMVIVFALLLCHHLHFAALCFAGQWPHAPSVSSCTGLLLQYPHHRTPTPVPTRVLHFTCYTHSSFTLHTSGLPRTHTFIYPLRARFPVAWFIVHSPPAVFYTSHTAPLHFTLHFTLLPPHTFYLLLYCLPTYLPPSTVRVPLYLPTYHLCRFFLCPAPFARAAPARAHCLLRAFCTRLHLYHLYLLPRFTLPLPRSVAFAHVYLPTVLLPVRVPGLPLPHTFGSFLRARTLYPRCPSFVHVAFAPSPPGVLHTLHLLRALPHAQFYHPVRSDHPAPLPAACRFPPAVLRL